MMGDSNNRKLVGRVLIKTIGDCCQCYSCVRYGNDSSVFFYLYSFFYDKGCCTGGDYLRNVVVSIYLSPFNGNEKTSRFNRFGIAGNVLYFAVECSLNMPGL